MAIRYQELAETRPSFEIVRDVPTVAHAELAAVRALLIEGHFAHQESGPLLSDEIRPYAIDVATNFFAINPEAAFERVVGIEPQDLSHIHEVVTNPTHAERFAVENPGIPADFIGLLHLDAEMNGRNIDETARVISDPEVYIPVERIVRLQNDLLGSNSVSIKGGESISNNLMPAEETVFEATAEDLARQILDRAGSFGDGISLSHLLRTNRRIANDIMKLGLPINNEGRSTHITVPFKTLIEAQVRSTGNPKAVKKALDRLMKGGE